MPKLLKFQMSQTGVKVHRYIVCQTKKHKNIKKQNKIKSLKLMEQCKIMYNI